MNLSRFSAECKNQFLRFSEWLKNKSAFLKKYPWAAKKAGLLKKVKSFRFKKIIRVLKKAVKMLSSSWRLVLGCLLCFVFFYYGVGSLLIDDTNVNKIYQPAKDKTQKSEIVKAMAFLINREIDSKMWTPNLPFVFPAYILDNMPNFQIGVIAAVRDTGVFLKKMPAQNPLQQEEIKKADEFLHYPPHIWLLSKKSAFSIAPSSNAQYRKARNELLKYNNDGMFVATNADFENYLARLGRSLNILIKKNNMQITEHSAEWLDSKADDVFYRNRGFAFGAWQIALAAGTDFKEIILEHDAYTEWTYLLAALQRAAEFKPLIVRNAEIDSLSAPNHLLAQNYFLERAAAYALQIRLALRNNNARQN